MTLQRQYRERISRRNEAMGFCGRSSVARRLTLPSFPRLYWTQVTQVCSLEKLKKITTGSAVCLLVVIAFTRNVQRSLSVWLILARLTGKLLQKRGRIRRCMGTWVTSASRRSTCSSTSSIRQVPYSASADLDMPQIQTHGGVLLSRFCPSRSPRAA
jgi:hypothetical protein